MRNVKKTKKVRVKKPAVIDVLGEMSEQLEEHLFHIRYAVEEMAAFLCWRFPDWQEHLDKKLWEELNQGASN